MKTTYVVLGCSKHLMNKLASEEFHHIKYEVKLIEDRLEVEKKLDKSSTARIFPILLDGDMKSSTPRFLGDFRPADYRMPQNYYMTTFLLAAEFLKISYSDYQHLQKELEVAIKLLEVEEVGNRDQPSSEHQVSGNLNTEVKNEPKQQINSPAKKDKIPQIPHNLTVFASASPHGASSSHDSKLTEEKIDHVMKKS